MNLYRLRTLILLSGLAIMTACGGSDGGGIGGPGPGGGSGWQPGVFLDANAFYAQCVNPRNGINPATGNPFPDVAGTILDENNFLRSLSDEIYLWYDEIVDQDPGLFNDTLAYFDELRTTALSPSGALKDKFHFTYDTEEYFQLSQGGVSSGYGANFVLLSTLPPREAVVAYSEPNSPAGAAGLKRGARVLEVDGVDINDPTQAGVDILNAGLFPSANGETHDFVVLDLGAAASRAITMTTADFTNAMVQNRDVLDLPTGRVGYMTFNFHRAPAEEELVNAINQLIAAPGIDDLVLDIRYNGGGFLDIAAQLAYMIAGPGPTAGKTFELLQFNDKHPITDPVTGNAIVPTPFHDETLGFSLASGDPLPTLGLSRVFVLTGGGTCSASEAIMNGLRGADVEVIQIGSTTCGKPYGFYPIDNCGTTYFTVQFRGVNEKNFGDYTDGFSPANTGAGAGVSVPGCSVGDDLDHFLGDPAERRLAAALAYRDGLGCPAPSGVASADGLSKASSGSGPADIIVQRSLWDSNRILRPQPQ
jgi:carboxyl-terminal processing protease